MTYRIPVFWTCVATVEIDADSLDEAVSLAYEEPLPNNWEYIPDSFEVDTRTVYSLNPEE